MIRTLAGLFCLALAPLAAAEDAWIVDTASGTLSQVSGDTIADEYGTKEVNPKLEFACEWGELTFRIDWGRFISSFNTEVGFRVDDGDATWLKLSVDSSNKMTVGKTSDAAKLVELIGDGAVLNVEVAPYSEPSVSVNYDLATFSTAMSELQSGCN